jgi:purine-binding chemotaxis protein CheW
MRVSVLRDPSVSSSRAEGPRILTALVFEVEGHRYGVDTAYVQQIVRAVLPVRLPRAPDVIIGVINVRGKVVPLLDLRQRFALPARPLRADEVFVIVEAKTRLLALRGDRTTELLRVAMTLGWPSAARRARARYASGTAVLPDGLLVICDVDAFLDEAEQHSLVDAMSAYPSGQVAP